MENPDIGDEGLEDEHNQNEAIINVKRNEPEEIFNSTLDEGDKEDDFCAF